MALPGVGGDDYPPLRPSGGPYYAAKRRTPDTVDDDQHYYFRHKRPRFVQQQPQFAGPVAFRAVEEPPLSYSSLHHPHPHHRYPSPLPHLPSPEPAGAAAPAMERTASGHSICPDPTERCASTELLEDHAAAQRVRDHLATFRRRNPDSKHERILRSIISPRPRRHHRHRHHHPSKSDDNLTEAEEEGEYPLDNAALESIFSTANEIFFNGRLTQRVAWDWSHSSSTRYDSRVIGTTALRRAAAHTRGFETLIVLSSTILRDPRYSRRLLISTFLHELIHCYLFICCGFRARWCGGHTDGFREIAGVIEEWVGEGAGLFLRRVEADLELFRVGGCGRHEEDGGERGGGSGERRDGEMHIYPCSGMAVEQEEYASAAVTSSGAQEVVYFRGGAAPGPGAGGTSPEAVYVGRGSSSAPNSRPSTPTQHTIHYYNDRGSGEGGSSMGWRRHHRVARPFYVYPGDEPTASYVYPDMGQRP